MHNKDIKDHFQEFKMTNKLHLMKPMLKNAIGTKSSFGINAFLFNNEKNKTADHLDAKILLM